MSHIANHVSRKDGYGADVIDDNLRCIGYISVNPDPSMPGVYVVAVPSDGDNPYVRVASEYDAIAFCEYWRDVVAPALAGIDKWRVK